MSKKSPTRKIHTDRKNSIPDKKIAVGEIPIEGSDGKYETIYSTKKEQLRKEITETFAAPPFSLPAATIAMFMKP